MMMYRCAIREVQTKIEVLNDELSVGDAGITGGIGASGFAGLGQNGYDPVLFCTG